MHGSITLNLYDVILLCCDWQDYFLLKTINTGKQETVAYGIVHK